MLRSAPGQVETERPTSQADYKPHDAYQNMALAISQNAESTRLQPLPFPWKVQEQRVINEVRRCIDPLI